MNSTIQQSSVSVRLFGLAMVVALVFLVSMPLSHAQSAAATGRLEGTVTDPSGAAVADAEIAVRNQNTGLSTTVRSDAEGQFVVLYLDPGTYEVTVQKSAFGKLVLKDITVTVGTRAIINPRLSLGKIDTTVTVRAETPLVDTAESSLGTVVNQQSIESLPLNGRNFTDFALLTPGATTDGDFGMISFNGVAGNYNNYTVDGGNNNNAFFAQQIGRTSIPYQFSEDVIREFQVTSTGFEAEFGQSGGGVVNTVTKSGTNQVHGDAYYYILDSATSANDKINEQQGIAKPHDRRQQVGGTIGGPLIRDRFFYLANFESQIRNEPLTVNDGPAVNGLPPDFFANNPSLACTGAGCRRFLSRKLQPECGVRESERYASTTRTILPSPTTTSDFRSPHGYFNTPTSTGDGLSLTDGATSHFLQVSLQTAFTATTVNEFRFHYGSDYHFDLPATPATEPAVTIQNPDTGFVFGGQSVSSLPIPIAGMSSRIPSQRSWAGTR